MPNSERVALVLTEAVVGPQVWQHEACDTMPDDEYERTKLAAVGVLELVARAVDWPRLLAEAEWRHNKLHYGTCPEIRGGWQPSTSDVCAECLREALLVHGGPGHTQNWVDQPEVARRAFAVDWPAVFAETIKFRRRSFRERIQARTRDFAKSGA